MAKINYYNELNLKQDASLEEIHKRLDDLEVTVRSKQPEFRKDTTRILDLITGARIAFASRYSRRKYDKSLNNAVTDHIPYDPVTALYEAKTESMQTVTEQPEENEPLADLPAEKIEDKTEDAFEDSILADDHKDIPIESSTCSNCGAVLDSTSKFCSQCGAKIASGFDDRDTANGYTDQIGEIGHSDEAVHYEENSQPQGHDGFLYYQGANHPSKTTSCGDGMKQDTIVFITEKSVYDIVNILQNVSVKYKATAENIKNDSAFTDPESYEMAFALSGTVSVLGMKGARSWGVRIFIHDMGNVRLIEMDAVGDGLKQTFSGNPFFGMGDSKKKRNMIANMIS